MIKKILFVDEDNTGLGPFAAALLRKKAAEKCVGVTSLSRGAIVLFPEPVNAKITEMASRYGLSVENHQAKMLIKEDFAPDVLVIAMDSASKKRAFDINSGFSNIFTLKEYVGEAGDIKLPIGESIDKYEIVCEMTDRLLDQLLKKISEEEN